MTYFVKVNIDTANAINVWTGYDACTGVDTRRCPAFHQSFKIVNSASLMHSGSKISKSGKIKSLRSAENLEATCREIAARAGVKNITTFVA